MYHLMYNLTKLQTIDGRSKNRIKIRYYLISGYKIHIHTYICEHI